jgi:protein SCO1/2
VNASTANSGKVKSQTLGLCLAAMFVALLLFGRPVAAQIPDPMQNIGVRPELLKDVSIDQRLNDQVPLNLQFHDEHGHPVSLAQFFTPGKPVVLSLVYFSCPMLCTEELNGLDRSLKLIPMSIGKDFQVVTVSIDPTDEPILAEAKRDLYTGMYGRPGAAEGWHFLTGENSQIKSLADSVGYHYAYDPDSKQFAHAALIVVLTGDGKISRYFYGVTYPSRDLRFGLEEASAGKIGSSVDQLLLFCYHYDPHTGKYGLMISRAIQIGGAVTLLALGALVFFLSRGEDYSLPRSTHA